MSPRVGIVVIGRNEGERLVRCLGSLPAGLPAVYVDSGSTDGSAAAALGLGAAVVELDLSKPFTAARARNTGLSSLMANHPGVGLVQFVDGDCELDNGWIEAGAAFLAREGRAGGVFGRLRERFPERSLYNRLCDLEWDEAPVGEVRACGGIVMMRAAALSEVGGFREDLIAGEEPELCVRLRERGWGIHRIDAEMALHDAAMTRFGQWWRRAVRAGHAGAEGAWLHGRGRDRHGVRTVASALVWGLGLPVAAVAAAVVTGGWSLLALLLYPLQWARLTARESRRGRKGVAGRYAALLLVSKFAHVTGIGRFLVGRLSHRPPTLIEHKAAQAPQSAVGTPAGGRV
ncbi:MAG: glycosyltransferase [Phycisphaerales bacterium]